MGGHRRHGGRQTQTPPVRRVATQAPGGLCPARHQAAPWDTDVRAARLLQDHDRQGSGHRE